MNTKLRAAWCHVLGLEKSDIRNDSNFFTEGGDSVTAMRLISVAGEMNMALDTETIFNHPVLMDMAKFCHPMELDKDSKFDARLELNGLTSTSLVQVCADACGVQQDKIEDIFPATTFQLLTFDAHMAAGAMILQTVYEIRGAFDVDVLRQTWQLLHDKNQILRTRLVKHDKTILQVVVNDTIQWQSDCNLARYKTSDMSKRVGSGDPLFRYAVVNEGDRRYFVWTCHHGGFDGWTRRIMVDKLQEGLIDMAKLKCEPQGPAFKSFVEWKDSQSEKKNEAVAFWKHYLGGCTPLSIMHPPGDYVRLSSSHFPRTIEMRKTTATKSMVTLSTTGHAAWAMTVASIWNVDDVLFATVKMGRQMAKDNPLSRADSIMGPIATMNPVRVALRKDIMVGDFLQQLQHQLLSTIRYEHEGWATFQGSFSARTVLPSMINWHPLGSDLFARTLEHKDRNGKVGYLKPLQDLSVDLTVSVSMLVDIYEHEDHLNLKVSYDPNIWEEKLVTKLVDTFTDILTKILLSREYKVGELLLDGAEGTTRLKARL